MGMEINKGKVVVEDKMPEFLKDFVYCMEINNVEMYEKEVRSSSNKLKWNQKTQVRIPPEIFFNFCNSEKKCKQRKEQAKIPNTNENKTFIPKIDDQIKIRQQKKKVMK